MATDKQGEEIARMPMWKSYLYHLQQQAPKPKRIVCQKEIPNKPPFYGREYHGAISREDADFQLTIGGEGSYLIRESQRAPGQFTLAIRFDGVTKNFKLYHDGQHYVGEKRFDTVNDLVADGLITFYLESKASDYIASLSKESNYAESPYVAYNTHRKRQLQSKAASLRDGREAKREKEGKKRDSSKESPSRGQRGHDRNRGERGERASRHDGAERSPRVERSDRGERAAAKRVSSSASSSTSGTGSTSGPGSGAASSVGTGASGGSAGSTSGQGQDKAVPNPTQSPMPGGSRNSRVSVNLPVEGSRLSQLLDKRENRKSTAQENRRSQQENKENKRATPDSHDGNRLDPVPQSPDEPADENGRVSHSTNTDGPKKASPHNSLKSRHIKSYAKKHGFKMLDEPHFSTPPSSPPPGMHLMAHDKHNLKPSSVSWCTDYLEVMGCEKPHSFKLYTFKGPHWCDYCANFLWGLIAQGVKCQDCGFNAHKKCSEHVPNDCMPDMKYIKRMFGVDLTTLVKAQNTLIPVVVELCVKEIESRGLEHEGLYRVAGFHDDVEAIKMSFDKDGELTDITTNAYEDINTITSLLKLYFRLLPIPLVTFDVYYRIIDIIKDQQISTEAEKVDMLRNAFMLLPPAHYHTLKYLCAHLSRVTEKQQQNMMNSENLAIVFAPTLLRSPETDPLTSLTAVKFERELIELAILNHDKLFDQ